MKNNDNDNKTNNFTVSVRIRPNLPTPNITNNAIKNDQIQYKILNTKTLSLVNPSFSSYAMTYGQSRNRKFIYDRVFQYESNRKIFEEIVEPKLSILQTNYNMSIFTYGVTGSGKTYTVFGSNNNQNSITKDLKRNQEGIALLAFQKVLKCNVKSNCTYAFSYLQIYNEQVHDLLCSDADTENNKLKSLAVLQDIDGNVKIPQLLQIEIKNIQNIEQLIKKGNTLRSCSSNLINKLSSRSHAILQLHITNHTTHTNNSLTIIDLAGSQKIPSSTSTVIDAQQLQKQGSNINKSLLSLANCIKCLQENKNMHVPYRDSKLTRILKNDLSGHAHNIMIACIGRESSQIQETVNTLQYAMRAKKIQVSMKQAAKNTNNKNYQCKFCGQHISWQEILKTIPQKYLKKPQPSKPNTLHFNLNLTLTSIMKQFREQIKKMLAYETQTQKYYQTHRSNTSQLFSRNYDVEESRHLSNNLEYSLSDIFQYYENKIRQNIGMYIQNGCEKGKEKDVGDLKGGLTGRIDELFKNGACDDMGVSGIQIDMNRPRIKSQFNKRDISNHDKVSSSLPKTQTFEQLQQIPKNKHSPILSFSSLQQQKQALLCIQNHTSSNLRRKLSIRPKTKTDLPTANTTRIHHSNNTTNILQQTYSQHITHSNDNNNQLQRMLYTQKIHRMKPDAQSDQQPQTNKQAIMRKLVNAKNKYYNNNNYQSGSNNQGDRYRQVQVSSFDLSMN